MTQRCTWCTSDPLYLDYHDHEWGVPLHDDRLLFELLILEGMQAGLSWLTVLQKRENYRLALGQFEPARMARFSDAQIQALLNNPGLIRNKRKIGALRPNAQAFLNIQEAFGRFDMYLWGLVDGRPVINHWRHQLEVPTSTTHSDTLSKDLKAHGFQFVGSTICYAYMQAAGLVMDHTTNCFRYPELAEADSHRTDTMLAEQRHGQTE